jgi:hypothetical protein
MKPFQWVCNIIAGAVLFSIVLVAMAACEVMRICRDKISGELDR